jgi:hypothetical protein
MLRKGLEPIVGDPPAPRPPMLHPYGQHRLIDLANRDKVNGDPPGFRRPFFFS